MKRIIVSLLVVVGALSSFAQSTYERQRMMEKSFAVKGGTGIEQFFIALLPGINEYYKEITELSQIDEGDLTVDKENGYIKWFMEGAGSMQIQCCCWKRSDGSKLVGLYYDEHDMTADDKINYESHVQFYTYNETTHCLDAINQPWTVEMNGHLLMNLPRKGKDVEYRFGYDEDMGNFSILKWNGNDFRPKGTPSSAIREGQHKLRLQWIEGVDFGSCKITSTGKKGEYTITGSHYNKSKTDWLKIDGTLQVVDSKRVRFNGVIRTRVYHIAGGVEQVRRGNMDFLSSGSRKYWRMQQMFNPGEGCLDYVDVFF